MPHRILFVDDDVLSQWVMTEVLSDAGFAVTSACRGGEAMRLIADTGGFDLLLTDFNVTDDADGVGLLRLWNEQHGDRPIIYTSGLSLTLAGRLEANQAFVRKPYDASNLLRVIDDLLDYHHGRQAAPNIVGRITVWH